MPAIAAGSDRGWALTNMTIYDYHMTMSKDRTVKVATLKARLSEYLRAVRSGRTVVVCDRDTPVARLVPYTPEGSVLMVREPTRALHAVALPKPLGKRVDSLSALLEERQSSR